MDALWRQWWRVGGIFGIGFAVLFIIGPVILTGDTPTRGDSIEDIRNFFADDGEMYLVGDYIGGIAFVVFFLPYMVTLRWVLGSGEGWPPIWSWLTVIGGVLVTAIGGAQSVFFGALAISEGNPEVIDDAGIRLLMEMSAYAFTGFSFTLALFVASASVVVLRTGVFWRWLAGLGFLAAILQIVGAAWPIDGDEEGALAILGFIGAPLTLLWILLSSIGMLMMKEEPAPTERAVANATGIDCNVRSQAPRATRAHVVRHQACCRSCGLLGFARRDYGVPCGATCEGASEA